MAEHRDDDDDDDLQLAGMRALWKSMPDEEPSNNGLAALMAAAREKAEEMKPRESWWQRVLVQLRRPPVLALATVVLLVGGGVIISQRDDMKAEVTAEDRTVSATPSAAGSSTMAPAGTTTLGEAERVGGDMGGKEDRALEAASVPTTGAAVKQPAPVVAPAEEKARQTVAKPAKTATTTATNKAKPKLEAQQSFTQPAPAKPADAIQPEATASPGAGGGAAAPKMSIAVDEMASAAPAPIDITSDSKVAAPKATRRAPVGSEAEKSAPSIDALIKQCEATAARGDCPGAKTLATRIEKADPKAYRARVITNATIKPCL